MSEEPKAEEEKVDNTEVTPPVPSEKEAKSVQMLVTYYPDTQEIKVQNVQNLTRPHAMYMTSRVLKTYEDDEIALAVVSKLSTVVEQAKDAKQGGKLWVPGAKK